MTNHQYNQVHDLIERFPVLRSDVGTVRARARDFGHCSDSVFRALIGTSGSDSGQQDSTVSWHFPASGCNTPTGSVQQNSTVSKGLPILSAVTGFEGPDSYLDRSTGRSQYMHKENLITYSIIERAKRAHSLFMSIEISIYRIALYLRRLIFKDFAD